MRTATTIFPTRSTALRAGFLASAAFMSPVERAMGRFMRSPDDHGGGDGGSGGSEGDAGAGDAGTGDAGAGDGDAGAGDAGDGGDAGAGDDDGSGGTALGDGSDEDGDADDGDGSGEGEGDGDASEGAPEAYDLTTEGVELDAEAVAEAEPVLRELGLTNDQAKKFVPLAAKLMDRAVDATVSDIVAKGNAQRKEWLDSAKAADDIGGAKWDATMHMAAKGLDALGFVKADKEKNVEAHPFRLALEATGFGNHPDMIRICAKLGELVSEDGDFVRADASAASREPVSKRLYPND
ncbi:hypothetical protein [Sphingopyxis macrogoltabida]|uniref:Uncharacterized protein n=1 Tax=Sphingopyxis macrogoltabida TaxID=33050 RepID=A0A0N9V2B5_SPHMC|nr:hypothetical protein [Sphingopyxis macrogoltabida]ALH82911.1 hypothetical protein AN936_21900 [Sphingopyxis macrogoltabida]